jgi:two-component system, LytTR family, response regulator
MTQPLRALIVDDEPVGRQCIRILLDADPEVSIVGEAANGVTGLAAVTDLAPDLLFLDVQMPGMNGFELLDRLPARRPEVIFSTAYDEYALRAFEVRAVDYLLKPFTNRRFAEAVAHAKSIALLRRQAEALAADVPEAVELTGIGSAHYLEQIAVKTSAGVILVAVEHIDWIEAAGDYVHLHAQGRAHLLRCPIGQLEARLDPHRFVRVHRATIVNLARLSELKAAGDDALVAVLPHGVRRRISRQGRVQLEKALRQRI